MALMVCWHVASLSVAAGLSSAFFLSLCLDFPPASKLSYHRPNGFIYQPIRATLIHSLQKDIPHHFRIEEC